MCLGNSAYENRGASHAPSATRRKGSFQSPHATKGDVEREVPVVSHLTAHGKACSFDPPAPRVLQKDPSGALLPEAVVPGAGGVPSSPQG